MDEKHCDMCGHYRMEDETMGWCARYREHHYPTDGRRCPGWEYWEDVPNDDCRNEGND